MNRLVRPSEWLDSVFLKIATEELRQLVMPHRKLWEYVSVIQAFQDLHVLDGTKVALGLGTGTEPLSFYFARRAAHVYACDLYSENAQWGEARVSLEGAYNQSPFPYPRERLEFRNMDMRRIDFPVQSIDFVWSCSAVEHVTSCDELIAIFSGIGRVLRPNGYAAITTEFNLTSEPHYLPNLVLFDESVLRRIETETNLRLVDPLDLTLEDHPFMVPFHSDYQIFLDYHRHLPHLWLQNGDLLFTSALLVFQNNSVLPEAQISSPLNRNLVQKYRKIGELFRRTLRCNVVPQRSFVGSGRLEDREGRPIARSVHERGVLQYGPYAALPSAAYCAQFRLLVQDVSVTARRDDEVCTVDVAAGGRGTFSIVTQESVRAQAVVNGRFFDVPLSFRATGLDLYEFRVTTSGNADVSFLGVSVEVID